MRQNAADHFGSPVLQFIDIVRDGTDGQAHRNIEFGDPLLDLYKHAGVGRDGQYQIDAVDGEKTDSRCFFIQRIGAENRIEFLYQV